MSDTVILHASHKHDTDSKSRVHVVFIHGIDPLDFGNLTTVVKHCKSQGFHSIHVLNYHQRREVIETIEAIKASDHDARILVFGYSAGAATARYVVKSLHEHHDYNVDALFYVSGIMLLDTPFSRPHYIGRIFHILENVNLIPGVSLTGAQNYRFKDVWHYGTPSHPQTIQLLTQELDRLAASFNQ